jgi:hypothetical protein
MDTWLTRLRALDVRLLAAVAAALMLIVGVMWVVPTTPTSNSFTFDLARRGLSDARPIELDEAVQGNLVDGSDADFYRIDPSHGAHWLDIHMMNGSATLIPGIWIIDSAKKVIQDQTAEYVRRPGANIDVSLLAQPDMTYYVTVFGQRNTTGPYTLTVSQRTSGQ